MKLIEVDYTHQKDIIKLRKRLGVPQSDVYNTSTNRWFWSAPEDKIDALEASLILLGVGAKVVQSEDVPKVTCFIDGKHND